MATTTTIVDAASRQRQQLGMISAELHSYGTRLTAQQITIHGRIITIVPKIVSCIDEQRDAVRAHLPACERHLFITTVERSCGKSTGLALFLAAMIANVPGLSVELHSHNWQNGVVLLERIITSVHNRTKAIGRMPIKMTCCCQNSWVEIEHPEGGVSGVFLTPAIKKHGNPVPQRLLPPRLICIDEYFQGLAHLHQEAIISPLGDMFFIGVGTTAEKWPPSQTALDGLDCASNVCSADERLGG